MRFLNKKSLLLSTFAAAMLFGAVSSANAALSRAPQDNIFFATSAEALSLDPALVDDNDSGVVISNIYESLLRFDLEGTDIEPALAESWDISEDGKTYTFHLRKNVKFHDGTPFNAEAVKINFDRQSKENLIPKMSYAPLVFGDVASTEVVDEYTVRVNLTKPSTPFLRNMAMSYAAPIVSPTALKNNNNDVSTHPVGTGPYKLFAWDRGQQIILTTNDEYWGEKPKTKNVIIRIVKETSARVVALKTGSADIINGVDSNVVKEIKDNGDEVFEAEGLNVNYMTFNCRPGYVTADPEVRRAIAKAINIEELVKSLYQGYAEPAKSFFPSLMPGHNPNATLPVFDPQAAKEVLEKKGVKTLKILTYSNARYYNTAGGQVLAEAVQAYLDKVGVKAEVEAYDWTTFKSKLLTDSWDLSFVGWVTDNADEDNFANILAATDPISNQGLWHNPEYIKLIQQGTEVPNGPERNAIYQKADAIISEDMGVLPISHAKTLLGHSKKVKNAMTHPTGMIYFREVDVSAKAKN